MRVKRLWIVPLIGLWIFATMGFAPLLHPPVEREAAAETARPGDCDENGIVSIAEVQRAINMFLGEEAPACGVDADGSGVVSISEVQRVINGYLGGAVCTVTCGGDVPESAFIGDPVQFSWAGQIAGCTGTPSFLWEFGDGGVSFLESPVHTYSAWGTYSWALQVEVDGEQCMLDGTIRVLPVTCTILECTVEVPAEWTQYSPAPFSSTFETIHCEGDPVYLWSFGDGATSAEEDPTHFYADEGTYDWSVFIGVDEVSCSQTGTIVVDYPCDLSCAADVPEEGYVGEAVAFAGSAATPFCSGNITYLWDFGDGDASTDPEASHVYGGIGTYAWSLIVSVDGETCREEGIISIDLPSCTIDCNGYVPDTARVGQDVLFQGDAVSSYCSGSLEWHWSFGDGDTSDQQSPIHVFDTEGIMNWTLAVTYSDETEQCIRTGSIEVLAACHIECSASDDGTDVVGDTVQFTGDATVYDCTGLVSFEWDFGDGGTSASQNPTHVYTAPGTYTWVMTVTADGQECVVSDSISLSYSDLAVSCSAQPVTGVAPLDVTFTCSPSGGNGEYAFEWDFETDGVTDSSLQNPEHTFEIGGTYTSTVTVTSGNQTRGCQTTVSISNPSSAPVIYNHSIYPDPLPTFSDGTVTFQIYDQVEHRVDWSILIINGAGAYVDEPNGSIPDGRGTVSVPIHSAGKTQATVRIEAQDINGDPATPQEIQLAIESPPEIKQIRATPSSILAGNSSLISFLISDEGDHQVDWTATLTNGGGGSLAETSGSIPNGNGYVSFQFDSVDPTTATITIEAVDVEGTAAEPKSVQVTVN